MAMFDEPGTTGGVAGRWGAESSVSTAIRTYSDNIHRGESAVKPTRNRSKRTFSFSVLASVLLAIAVSWPVEAHAPGVVLTGFGTATIDGIISPGEWDNAGSVDFLANVPPNDGGGTTPATLFVMNDATNLYLALKIARSSIGGATNPSFEFDNNHNGVRNEGDDLFGMSEGIFSPPTFIDAFRTSQPPCPAGLCGLGDVDFGGTNDGTADASNDGSFTYVEISHPLDSADDAHDFSLGAGDIVGFTLRLRLFSLDPACNFGFNCLADTDFPTFPSLFGDIEIASSAIITTADAGPDQLVTVAPGESAMVTLDGSGSSGPNSDPLTFTWTNSFDGVVLLDQEQPLFDFTTVGAVGIGGNSEQKLAQVITAGISGPLAEVRMPILLSAGNLRISVNNTIADAPGNTILASVLVAAADLPGSFPTGVVFSSIVFDTPAFFSPGDQFSIVLECEGSPGSCQGAYVQGPVGNPYPGGNGWFDSRPNQPGVWVPIGGNRFDFPFQTFVLGSTAGPAMGEMPTVALGPGVHTITLTVDDGKGGMDSDTVEITVNRAPVADAGPDQVVTVAPGDTAMVTLDGSGSSDLDGDPLTFTWTNAFGAVMGATPTVTLGPGVHTITLTVDDGKGGMDSDTVEITVNQPPVAEAGPDQLVTVAPGDTAMVTLDGSGSSDPDGDPLTFTWTNSFGPAMGEMPTVALAPGVHTITLTVDDGKGGMDSDTVEITVNQAPVADAGPDQVVTVAPGDTAMVTLDGSGSSDLDGDPLTFTWTNSFGPAIGVMPTVALGPGVHTITLTVDDGKSGMDSDTVEITINQPPVANAGADQTLECASLHGASMTLDGSGSLDPDGDPLTFTWTGPFPEGGGVVTGVSPTVTLPLGSHTITLTVEDDQGASDTDDVMGIVQDTTKPTLTLARNSTTISVPTKASEASVDVLAASGAAASDLCDPSPLITTDAPDAFPLGVTLVTITARDASGNVIEKVFRVTVTTPRLEVSPQQLMFDLPEGSEPASQPFTVQAINGRVRYLIHQTASWAHAEPNSGVSNGEVDQILAVVGHPQLPPGTYTKNLSFRENGVLTQKLAVTLIVRPVDPPPDPPPFAPPEYAVVDAASFIPTGQPGHEVARKSIIAIFGENFTDETAVATTIPLPTTLAGIMVTFDGIKAPLFAVTPNQIIAQLPMGVEGDTATMVVTKQDQTAQSLSQEVPVVSYSPAIFTFEQNGQGQGVVVFTNSTDLAGPVALAPGSRPAREGDYLTIYANALGPVTPFIADGTNSCDPDGQCLPDFSNIVLRETTMKPKIFIGGVEVPEENIVFSGFSPAFVAVYEVIFKMPAGLPVGDTIPILVEIGDGQSRGDVTIAIE